MYNLTDYCILPHSVERDTIGRQLIMESVPHILDFRSAAYYLCNLGYLISVTSYD